MPGFQLLMEPREIVYRYDGSLAGFYSCVHACVYGRELPLNIESDEEQQISLFPARRIDTNIALATRVRNAVAQKISPGALELCEHVFLSCLEKKEMAMLRFLALGFATGRGVENRLAEPVVDTMLQAEKHLLGEAHLLLGFVRFSDHNGKLLSAISPKNFVLPLIAPHFADRYSQENFLIYDRTHRVALVYENGKVELCALEGEWPEASETELFYQALWKQFYHTIAIRERENPKCRRTHMPKRYWENMVEMQPLLHEPQRASCLAASKAKNTIMAVTPGLEVYAHLEG